MIGNGTLGKCAAHPWAGVNTLAGRAGKSGSAVSASLTFATAAARSLVRVTLETRRAAACGGIALFTALGVGAARGWDAWRAGGWWTNGTCEK